jgi:hypothetical protein
LTGFQLEAGSGAGGKWGGEAEDLCREEAAADDQGGDGALGLLEIHRRRSCLDVSGQCRAKTGLQADRPQPGHFLGRLRHPLSGRCHPQEKSSPV